MTKKKYHQITVDSFFRSQKTKSLGVQLLITLHTAILPD